MTSKEGSGGKENGSESESDRRYERKWKQKRVVDREIAFIQQTVKKRGEK